MITWKKHKTSWYKIYRCIECDHQMSFHTMMNSHATCPYCGYSDFGTVCDCIELGAYSTYERMYLFGFLPLPVKRNERRHEKR